MKKYKVQRSKGVLQRLEAQLNLGKKTEKGSRNKKVDLTDKDIKRIEKEIETIKKRQL